MAEALASNTNAAKNNRAYAARDILANKDKGVFTNNTPRWTKPTTVMVNLRSEFSAGQGQIDAELESPPGEVNVNENGLK